MKWKLPTLLMCSLLLIACSEIAGKKEHAVIIFKEIAKSCKCETVEVVFKYTDPDDGPFRSIHITMEGASSDSTYLPLSDFQQIATEALAAYPGKLQFDSVYVSSKQESKWFKKGFHISQLRSR